MERFRDSTIEEFNLAVAGYWRVWERSTAWLMREVVYNMIAGNPYIKQIDKPKKEQIMKLSFDKEEKPKIITKKELEKLKERMSKL